MAFKPWSPSRQFGHDKLDRLFRRHGRRALEGEKLLCDVFRLFPIDPRVHELYLLNATRDPVRGWQLVRSRGAHVHLSFQPEQQRSAGAILISFDVP